MDSTLLKSLVGSLMYLICTRPDILVVVGVVSRFMEAPTSTHLEVAKRILRFLKGTIDLGLFYSSLIILILWDIVIVIMREMFMIEKTHRVLCFSWVIVLFLGVQRNNQLLFFRLVNLNIWQRHHVRVMLFG